MDQVTLLARFWGWLMVILCLLYLFNPKGLERFRPMVKDLGFITLSGFMALIIGLASLLLYSEWSMDWPVVITLFGWLSLIKGCVRIYKPELMVAMLDSFSMASYRFLLGMMAMLGGVLVYLSYYG